MCMVIGIAKLIGDCIKEKVATFSIEVSKQQLENIDGRTPYTFHGTIVAQLLCKWWWSLYLYLLYSL